MYFFLKEPKRDKDTLIYLIFFVKSEGKNFKYSTGQKIHPDDWDFELRMPKSKRGAGGIRLKHISSVLNRYFDHLEQIIRNCELENLPITKDLLKESFDVKFKNKIKSVKSDRIVDVIPTFIEVKNLSLAQSRAWNLKYKNLKKKIELFEKEKKTVLKFSDIDEAFLDEYCGFLRTINEKPFKPHNDNTLNRNIKFLFSFLKWCKGEYHQIDFTKLKNPVKTYQADDVHLTDQEIKLIEDVELPENLDASRDMFLIGIYSGQRFSDYSVFEKADIQGDMIIKRAEKTEKECFIPLHEKLKNILDKYDWDLPKISNFHFNKHIHTICEKAKIDTEVKETIYRGNQKEVVYRKKFEMISSHTARRTFITLSSEKGMPDHIIMKITGIRKVETLAKYKKTTQKSVVDSMNKIWG